MAIFNTVYGGGGSSSDVYLSAIADLTATKGNAQATITWTDPSDVVISGYTLATWNRTILVRKVGSAPTNSSDGTVVLTETVRDTYSSSGYVDTGLTNDTTYYYAAFAVAHNGNETISNIATATPKATQVFTVTFTETSDPTAFAPTYSDDASGLTAGSTDFDDFFNYSAVLLDTSGNETASVAQSAGVLDITSLGTISGGDNVMIKFPRMGIKMSKSGSTVTLSITDEDDATGYTYYAHNRGTFDSPTKKDAFYMGVYEGYASSSVLKSWSGQTPTVSQTQATFISYARANDSNSGDAGYEICGFYQRQFINALYMMKYGNPNSQSVVGAGYTGGSASVTTGGTNSQTSATYGTSSTTTQIKLFGLEDWWGNIYDRVGGMCTDSSKNLYTALSGYTGAITTSSPYASQGTYSPGTSSPCMSAIAGTDEAMFYPSSTVSNSSYNTYWCDYGCVYASRLAIASGDWSRGAIAGAFYLYVYYSASSTSTSIGARLMFL